MKHFIKSLVTRVFGDPFILRAYQRKDIERALGGANQEIVLLDVGAGELGLTCWLKRRHAKWKVVACDLQFSKEAVEMAAAAKVSLCVTDGDALPVVAGGYDRILLSSVLQMVPEPEKLLARCLEHLRADSGRLVLTVPAEYHFLARLCSSSSWAADVVRWIFGVPSNLQELDAKLRQRFGVQGPKGHYSQQELMALLQQSGFRIEDLQRTPGWAGTLAWELSLLLSLRGGTKMFLFMGLVYPVVWLADSLSGSRSVGEHLLSASRTLSQTVDGGVPPNESVT